MNARLVKVFGEPVKMNARLVKMFREPSSIDGDPPSMDRRLRSRG